MSDDEFWALIEDARHSNASESFLQQQLAALPLDGLMGFENTLRRMLGMASTFPVLTANFLLLSYTSDDVFEDFRAWLVLQGRSSFDEAVRDPASIARLARLNRC